MSKNDDEPLKPLTFKVPKFMFKKMEELVENGEYESRAEMIRIAIQKLIDWELKIPSLSSNQYD